MSETSPSTTAETSSFAPGAPSWIDVSSTDKQASKAFYTGLFGWDASDLGEEAGGYIMFELGGRIVAALGGVQEGQPSAWSVYFNAPDAEATAGKVEAAGGRVIVAPFDVLDQGSMAVFMDPTGAFFSIWEMNKMPGLGLLGEPNTFGWCELNTGNVDSAADFYASVFGWGAHRTAASEGGPGYTEWQLDGQSFGGAIQIGASATMPADIPPHWLVYFMVDDIDARTARVSELGGSVKVGPEAYPGGKFSVVAEPGGAHFGLMQTEG